MGKGISFWKVATLRPEVPTAAIGLAIDIVAKPTPIYNRLELIQSIGKWIDKLSLFRGFWYLKALTILCRIL